MPKEVPSVEIKQSLEGNKHGLCNSAETHWAIYAIQLLKSKQKPTLHEAQVDGKKFAYLTKGEDLPKSGFTFGEESFLVVSSEDPNLQGFVFVEEGKGVFVGRPLTSLEESLRSNFFYDDSITSRWKDVVADFAKERGVAPKALNLMALLAEVLQG